MTDNIMGRLHELNSRIMGEPPNADPPKMSPTKEIPKSSDPLEQALSLIERQPAARISPRIAVQLCSDGILNNWEEEFLINTSGQEPSFTAIPHDHLYLPPLSHRQTERRVLIAIKILRAFNRINDQHWKYLEKIQAAD